MVLPTLVSSSHTHTCYASLLKWCVKRDVWIVRVDRRGTIAPLFSVGRWAAFGLGFTEAFGSAGLGAQAPGCRSLTRCAHGACCSPGRGGPAIIPQ